jgi:hypothetical protein
MASTTNNPVSPFPATPPAEHAAGGVTNPIGLRHAKQQVAQTTNFSNTNEILRHAWSKCNGLVLKHHLESCNKGAGCPFTLKEHILLVIAKACVNSANSGRKKSGDRLGKEGTAEEICEKILSLESLVTSGTGEKATAMHSSAPVAMTGAKVKQHNDSECPYNNFILRGTAPLDDLKAFYQYLTVTETHDISENGLRHFMHSGYSRTHRVYLHWSIHYGKRRIGAKAISVTPNDVLSQFKGGLSSSKLPRSPRGKKRKKQEKDGAPSHARGSTPAQKRIERGQHIVMYIKPKQQHFLARVVSFVEGTTYQLGFQDGTIETYDLSKELYSLASGADARSNGRVSHITTPLSSSRKRSRNPKPLATKKESRSLAKEIGTSVWNDYKYELGRMGWSETSASDYHHSRSPAFDLLHQAALLLSKEDSTLQ